MKRLAFWIAAAALLVSAPRLALAFLLADGVILAPAVEATVYAGTGIASGLVLTGGNVYLAHALAQHYKRRGPLWLVLLGSWILFLGFTVVLIAPALVAGLTHSVLAEVLASPQQRWLWAVVAALSVEVLAAAAMAAHVLSAEPTQATARSSARQGISSAMSDAAVRLLTRVAPSDPAATERPSTSAAAPTDAAGAASAQPPTTEHPERRSWHPERSGAQSQDERSILSGGPAGAVVEGPQSPDAPRYPCRTPGCDRSFATPQARVAHEARAHRAPATVAARSNGHYSPVEPAQGPS